MCGEVTSYIGGLSEPERSAVLRVLAEVRRLVPEVTEGRSYGMPCLMFQGKPLIAVVVRKAFISAYPYSGRAVAAAKPELAGLATTSGSVHFTPSHPIPPAAVAAMVHARLQEIKG